MSTNFVGVNLPERREAEASDFDMRPDKVDKWLSELHMVNVGETTRSVFYLLYQTNRIRGAWQSRFAMLEKLRDTIFYVESVLHHRIVNQNHPLSEQARQIVSLVQSLHEEASLAYKVAIEEMSSGSPIGRDHKVLAQMIYRAIGHMNRVLLISYQSYLAVPAGMWHDLHQLYRYAREQQLHTTVIRDDTGARLPESTIEQLYMQITLLSLASPLRMRQGEAELTYSALRSWVRHAEIIAYEPHKAHAALFVIHLMSDHEPEYMVYSHVESAACDKSSCMLLNTSGVVSAVHHEYEAQKNAEMPLGSNLSSDLLKRLARSWGLVTKRHANRLDAIDSIEAVVGLTAVHQALLEFHQIQSIQGDMAHFTSKSVLSENEEKPDVWNIFSPDKLLAHIEQGHSYLPQKAYELVVHKWQIQNESSSGYRLSIHDEWADIEVGKLLGLRRQGSDSWQLGVVRWLADENEAHLSIGVQLIAPRAIPVMVKQVNSGAEFQRCLLVPAIRRLHKTATMITPIRIFEQGSDIQLYGAETVIPLRLDKTLQETDNFIQFAFAQRDEVADDKALDLPIVEDRFESLWKHL